MKLDRNTWIPLGAAVVVTGVIVRLALLLNSTIDDLSHQIELGRRDMRGLARQVEAMREERWTRPAMKHWAEMLRVQNPSMVVPEVGN